MAINLSKEQKELIKVEKGFGITGVNIHMSIMDIVTLEHIIAHINTTDTDSAVAKDKLNSLLLKCKEAIATNSVSVFDEVTPEEEIIL